MPGKGIGLGLGEEAGVDNLSISRQRRAGTLCSGTLVIKLMTTSEMEISLRVCNGDSMNQLTKKHQVMGVAQNLKKTSEETVH